MAWFVPAMMAASTALTLMGHRQNIKNIKANAAWKNYENELSFLYDKQKMLKKQKKLLSTQRARTAASGVQFTGSPLIIANADIEEMENDLAFLEKGVFIKNAALDAEATGLIASETYKAGASLFSSAVSYQSYKQDQAIAKKLGIG